MIKIIEEKCTLCGECIRGCPFGAIKVREKRVKILDNCVGCSVCVESCKEGAILIERQEKKENLSNYKGVWVFIELTEGKVREASLELLGKAKELGEKGKEEVGAIVLGKEIHSEMKEELGKYGADKVYVIEDELLSHYSTEPYSRILTALIAKYKPNIVLYPATHIGRDLAPRVASTLNLGLTADCTELYLEDKNLVQVRPAFGGNIMAEIITPNTRPQMATVRPHVMKKREKKEKITPKIINEKVNLTKKSLRITLKEVIKTTSSSTKKIDESDVIIAGGRGVGSKEGFSVLEELASLLNGVVGASRVAVEMGWMPKALQVGQSGTTVSPKLYIACGISGAIQHIVGMSSSQIIIAINKDPNAPIFDVATYGVVGDLFEVVPKLIEKVKEIKGKK